jgi:hypothetical protein
MSMGNNGVAMKRFVMNGKRDDENMVEFLVNNLASAS